MLIWMLLQEKQPILWLSIISDPSKCFSVDQWSSAPPGTHSAYCNRKAIENPSLPCGFPHKLFLLSLLLVPVGLPDLFFHQSRCRVVAVREHACVHAHISVHTCTCVQESVEVWKRVVAVARLNMSVEDCELLLCKVWRRTRAPARKHFHLNLLTAYVRPAASQH